MPLKVISLSVTGLSYQEALSKVIEKATHQTPSYACFSNVHMCIEAYKDPIFAQQVNQASFVFPDGVPIQKAASWLYRTKQERVAGMDFMPSILQEAHLRKLKVFLFGTSPEMLDLIQQRIKKEYANLMISGAVSPPFRPLSKEDNLKYAEMINESGTHIVLVALGCPKQEKWMAENTKNINAVLLGVGGAFPVFAQTQSRAPIWMQKLSMEWLYRLFQEPKRLFKRYFYTNTLFILLFIKAFWTIRILKKNQNDMVYSSPNRYNS